MTCDDIKEHHLVVTKQPAMIIVILLVICLHAALLMSILNSSSVQKTTITMPVIAGVLIKMPSPEVVKAVKKIIRKKPTPVPEPKRLAEPKKAITLPPVEKQIQPPEVQETIDTAEESVEEKPAPVVSPRVDATRQSNPAPVYPRTSLRRKEQGKVILEVLIQVDGSVGEIRIKQSSGFKRLDKSAMKAVKRWRYIAAQQAGQAIEYWYQQPIVFSLRNKV